jgi:hypothetical protein
MAGKCLMQGAARRMPIGAIIGILVIAVTFGPSPAVTPVQAQCDCPWVGDVNADGSHDILDLVMLLDATLDNGPITQDADCPRPRVDYNADGFIDVRDVTNFIDELFQAIGGPQDPCECETQPQLCDPLTDPTPGDPGNSVVVESRTIVVGATDAPIAISLTNDTQLRAVVVPLIVREITPGSFITSATQSYGDRLTDHLTDIRRANQYATPDGACPGGFHNVTYTHGEDPTPVAASPEGFLFQTLSIMQGALPAGSDATGSMVLTVDVTSTSGTFEIDTTCLDPNTHLLFVENQTGVNPPIIPSFTKGTITISPNTPPVALCQDVTVPVGPGCTPVDVSVDNGSYDPDGGGVTLTQDPPGPYDLGETVVTLTVEDDVGGSAQCQATVTVEDNTPPEIVCPDDIFLNIPPVYQGWVIAYEVSATDNCPGDVTIVCSQESGTFFPNGTTEVTCTATDASGNEAECSFLVTIEAQCYDRLSDVNCDGVTDVLDMTMIIDIIYQGAPEAPPCASGPQ